LVSLGLWLARGLGIGLEIGIGVGLGIWLGLGIGIADLNQIADLKLSILAPVQITNLNLTLCLYIMLCMLSAVASVDQLFMVVVVVLELMNVQHR